MQRETRRRLFSLLVLVVLVTAALVLPAVQTNAYAAVCCENCPYFFERCLAGTAHSQCHGDSTCCGQWVDSFCTWSCVYC
jgi:hypothetical protein